MTGSGSWNLKLNPFRGLRPNAGHLIAKIVFIQKFLEYMCFNLQMQLCMRTADTTHENIYKGYTNKIHPLYIVVECQPNPCLIERWCANTKGFMYDLALEVIQVIAE